jgi:hypothetical protein
MEDNMQLTKRNNTIIKRTNEKGYKWLAYERPGGINNEKRNR